MKVSVHLNVEGLKCNMYTGKRETGREFASHGVKVLANEVVQSWLWGAFLILIRVGS